MILNVSKQKITITTQTDTVSGTVNAGEIEDYFCEFVFGADWSGYTKTAVFKNLETKESFVLPLTNNECIIPPDVIKYPDLIQIGVYGINGENVYPTVWSDYVHVLPGCYTDDMIPPVSSRRNLIFTLFDDTQITFTAATFEVTE